MNKGLKQTSWLVIGTALAVFSAIGTVLADDIEIFVAGEDPDSEGGVYPNIMFIIDTSGSMGTEVQTQDAYDDDIVYPGACDPDYLYVTKTSTAPSCNGNTTRIKKSLNLCFAAQKKFDSGQFYSDRLLIWKADKNSNASKWISLPNSGEITSPMDCRGDRRTNKNTADGSWPNDNKYARDGRNGPYYPYQQKNNDNKNQAVFSTTYYLWSGNLLNWGEDAPLPKTRLETVQDVVVNMLEGLSGVNVGLMRFNNSQGGPVLIDIQDIDDNKVIMQKAVSDLTDDGWTPLSETFYEFGQYMYGKSVVYGDGYQYKSVAASRTGGDINSKTYDSPAEFLCQKNYVIYLTDGEPTEDTGAETAIEQMIGKQCVNSHGSSNGKCLDELAEYYANTPVKVGGEEGQPIRTYTIGFNIDLKLLADTARKGNPSGNGELGYYTADDTSQLATTLTKIAVEILKDSTTFTAPAVPVNSFNRTENLNTVYTSLFQPSSSVHWPGNLKRYAFKNGEFIGQDKKPAIDPLTGFFSEAAWSEWTNTPDGNDITVAGAAGRMPYFGARKIVTDINSDTLMAATNDIAFTNKTLTAETFGAPPLPAKETFEGLFPLDFLSVMVNWMNGMDLRNFNNNTDANGNPLYTDTRRQYGDPLHARPVPVVYGGTSENPDIVVYLTTNDGQLHAVEAATGDELWSYVPASVLNRMYSLYVDEVTAIKSYILDGQPVVYVLNDDGKPGFKGPGEKAIMVFGMRRGGSSYFALDITDKNNPKKLWEINDDSAGDFPYMGQSWSEPQMGWVQLGSGSKTPVMFIGGGYDANQDTNVFATDTRGNAVYMIDLLTGDKLWSAGNSNADHNLVLNMEHSIPAPPLVIDTNFDGLLDRLYVPDMGGRIWRMDFINGNSVSTFAEGGMLATLGAADLSSPAEADLRRFYSKIDLVEDVYGETRYFALNIGSGYRAHPLDKDIDEEFYSVRDFKPYAQLKTSDPTYSSPVTRNDLIDITTRPTSPVSPTSAGWKLNMKLGEGEKVLGKSLTINGIVYFTSFSPGGNASSCTADKGTNRLYSVSLGFGRPVVNLDVMEESEDYSTEDFATDLKFGGLGSEVFLMSEKETVYDDDGNATGEQTSVRPCSSLVCGTDKIVLEPTRTYWTQEGM